MQIERKRGDTYADVFTITNRKTKASVNLTGCLLKLTVSRTQSPIDVIDQVYQIEGVITNPETGVVEFSPTLEQSNQVGYFHYDIQMTDMDGVVRTMVSGVYLYTQDITK